jgi:hypothetical protein
MALPVAVSHPDGKPLMFDGLFEVTGRRNEAFSHPGDSGAVVLIHVIAPTYVKVTVAARLQALATACGARFRQTGGTPCSITGSAAASKAIFPLLRRQ